MNSVYKCFQTPCENYLYDRRTNKICMIPEEDYEELNSLQTKQSDPKDIPGSVEKYQEKGFLLENTVEKIEHPESKYIDFLLNNKVEQLILQVTQQCNLRCGYCVYSGLYKNRKHANKRMSLEMAYQAIDFYLAHAGQSEEYTLGFYGGEPLLEYELIKKCIAYTYQRANGKTVRISFTTNGTLLTDEIVDFCVKNEVYLTISLDGSKEEHDANRKFANGKGSFDTIIQSVRRIKERYPEYYRDSVLFNTVLNPKSDISCVQEYFSTEQLFADRNLIFSAVNISDLNDEEEMDFDDRYYAVRKYEYLKFLLSLLGKVEENAVSPLYKNTKSEFIRRYNNLKEYSNEVQTIHPSGPCVPGVKRVFVSVEGKLFPCERVSESEDIYCIGSLDTGYDYEKVYAMLNVGQVTKKECVNCWNVAQCNMCAGHIPRDEDGKGLSKKEKLKMCETAKLDAMSQMIEMCVLKEHGYEFMEGV